MLSVLDLKNDFEYTVNIGELFANNILLTEFVIQADGEALDFILEEFTGIKKNRSRVIQIFVGDDAKHIAANWNVLMAINEGAK